MGETLGEREMIKFKSLRREGEIKAESADTHGCVELINVFMHGGSGG